MMAIAGIVHHTKADRGEGKNMSTLITGGAGFIGAEVVRILIERGETRLAIFSRNPKLDRHSGTIGDVDAIRGDVGVFSHVLDAVSKAKPDVIYHFGAMLSTPSEEDPASSIQTNAMGTFHVLEAARIFGVRKVIFASSIGVFGSGIEGDVIDDFTIQRPVFLYGATKLFGEHLGLFYRRKYGIDFRGLRYPSVIGPGVRSPGVVQYTSWLIEESAKGNPYTMKVSPELQVPVMYIKEAGQAAVQLSDAPEEEIKTVVYNVDGMKPTPSAKDLVSAVEKNVPSTQINFDVDTNLQAILGKAVKQMDDSRARAEWAWNPTYPLDRIVKEFVMEIKLHPERYD